jgi:hypothetical protein
MMRKIFFLPLLLLRANSRLKQQSDASPQSGKHPVLEVPLKFRKRFHFGCMSWLGLGRYIHQKLTLSI